MPGVSIYLQINLSESKSSVPGVSIYLQFLVRITVESVMYRLGWDSIFQSEILIEIVNDTDDGGSSLSRLVFLILFFAYWVTVSRHRLLILSGRAYQIIFDISKFGMIKNGSIL